jgi:hypothetical protein
VTFEPSEIFPFVYFSIWETEKSYYMENVERCSMNDGSDGALRHSLLIAAVPSDLLANPKYFFSSKGHNCKYFSEQNDRWLVGNTGQRSLTAGGRCGRA